MSNYTYQNISRGDVFEPIPNPYKTFYVVQDKNNGFITVDLYGATDKLPQAEKMVIDPLERSLRRIFRVKSND